MVSPHSRPKAAALSVYEYQQSLLQFQHTAARRRLRNALAREMNISLFQHTAARRRLPWSLISTFLFWSVSTHSRPKAAATAFKCNIIALCVSTHSRPKAAAGQDIAALKAAVVSTHSRPKAAAYANRYP